MRTKTVVCGGCGRKRLERNMKIYDVHTDTYFCDQRCKNNKDGIKRDKDGFVISMMTKKNFKTPDKVLDES